MDRSEIGAQLVAWAATTAWIHLGLDPSLTELTATASGGSCIVGHFGIVDSDGGIGHLSLLASGVAAAIVAAVGILLRRGIRRIDRWRVVAFAIPGLAVFAGLLGAFGCRYGLSGEGFFEFLTVALAVGITAGVSWGTSVLFLLAWPAATARAA